MEPMKINSHREMENKDDVVHIYNGILLSHRVMAAITITQPYYSATGSNKDGPRDDSIRQRKTNITGCHLQVESTH